MMKAHQDRLTKAKADRATHEPWLQEIYRLAMPWRTRFGMQAQQTHDHVDVYDGTLMEAVSDFASDLLATYTPTDQRWIEQQVILPPGVSEADRKRIARAVADQDAAIFEEIRASNFYEAVVEANADLALGTAVMHIDEVAGLSYPIHCQALPLVNTYVCAGPYGRIDGVYREQKVTIDHAQVLWPGIDLGPKLSQKKGTDEITIIDGGYRDWKERGTPTWQYAVFESGGKDVMLEQTMAGEGAWPLVGARWLTDTHTAWGIGPAYKALPWARTADELAYLILKNANWQVDPVRSYTDDGVINLDTDIVPGTWIPVGPDGEIRTIENPSNLDIGYFTQDDLRRLIKHALYQDKPEQRGRTPPTATQWLDEALENQRRQGAPLGRLAVEWLFPIFMRFRHLLIQRGTIAPVLYKDEQVRLRLVSPLLRAARQEDAVTGARFLEILNGSFPPETVAMLIDATKTAHNLQAALRDEIIALRTEEEAAQLLASLAQGVASAGRLSDPIAQAPPAPARGAA
ncbi:MAG: hypothetical protein HXY25_06980 [Alphaproteobacteria bacterium]|nr:hypothetical protein [Alphaproteobacteria bacterium]